MTLSSDLAIASTTTLPSTLDYFGPAALVRGEAASSYDTLLARVSGTVKPADILEEIWVRDVVDLVWDALRQRRLKAALLTASAYEGVNKVLLPIDGVDAHGLSRRWAAGDVPALRRVDALLAAAGLTMDAVMAQALRVRLDEIERIDRQIMTAEARRNVALRELDRHRAAFAERLRRAAQAAAHDVEDAEFEDVTPAAAPALGQQDAAQDSADAAA
jgi:hypothetical protein